jgi:hypothetical protein
LFSGFWERPFSKGDEHLLKKDHYCEKCKNAKERQEEKD